MEILFVRKRNFLGGNVYDVVYKSNPKRCRIYWNVPKTVEKFISEAQAHRKIDKEHGEVIIYTKGE